MLDCCASSRECCSLSSRECCSPQKEKKERKPILWKCANCFDTRSNGEWKGALVSHQLFQFCSETCRIQWLKLSNKEQLLKSPVLIFESLKTPPSRESVPPTNMPMLNI